MEEGLPEVNNNGLRNLTNRFYAPKQHSAVQILPESKAYGSTPSANPSSMNRVCISLGIFVAVAFLIELMVIFAMVTGPSINMMHAMQSTMESMEQSIQNPLQVNLNLDSGANLTKVLADNKDLLSAGRTFLSSPGMAGGSSNTTISEESEKQFMKWCESAPCMKESSEDCKVVEENLKTARGDDGKPVMPLPKEFCEAIDALSSNRCLCDKNLSDPDVVGETAAIIDTAPLLGSLCGVSVIAPSKGNC